MRGFRGKKVDPVRTAGGSSILTGRPDRNNAATVAPPPLREGQVRCPSCRNAVRLTASLRLRRHVDLFGDPCFDTAPTSKAPEFDPAAVEALRVALAPSPNARPVNGHCHRCDKRIPTGRRLCGRCYATGP